MSAKPLNLTELREVFDAFSRALIEAPHSYGCERNEHKASGKCTCWRDESVAVFMKYQQRARYTGRKAPPQRKPEGVEHEG